VKRDFDLIRRILKNVQACPSSDDFNVPEYEGYDYATVAEHVELLIEADLVRGKVYHTRGGASPHISRLTWAGHEFLDAAQDEGLWAKAKRTLGEKLRGIPFEVLVEFLKWQAKEALGMPV
jgi:hypothetical protein